MVKNKYKPADIKIYINGAISKDFLGDILKVSVEESLHFPSVCLVTINNNYQSGRKQDKPWEHDSLLKIGDTIDVTLASSTTEGFDERKEDKLFSGEITSIESHFYESQAPITIRAYDVSHRLHRGRYNRSFQNMTDSGIVRKIAAEMGIVVGNIGNSGAPHEYLFQENQTNMEFLRERAFRLGFELYVKDKKLNFCRPKSQGKLNLIWLEDIGSFHVRVNSAEQVDSVEVRGWDYQTKKAIVAEVKKEIVLTKNKNGSCKKVTKKFRSIPKVTVVDRPVFSKKEADRIAQGLYDRLAGQYVCADATGQGNPNIQVGKVITLSNMGKYDGQYYITETRHLCDERVYTTSFTIRGLKSGNLLELLSPSRSLKPAQTLLVGKVTNNNDPKKWGRVKVKLPTLTEAHESNWARVVGVGAGKNRGFDCLPEVNDEVLVGFEHGDIHRPYIIGGVWNGVDSPPELVTNNSVVRNKVRLRTIKTRTGHIFQFVEEDKGRSTKGVYLKTAKGHQINLNDSQGKIEIKTKKGHKIVLNDKDSTISIESTGNLKINAKKDIDITAKGNIKLKGKQIHLN